MPQDKSEAIRKAVEQARLEIGAKSKQTWKPRESSPLKPSLRPDKNTSPSVSMEKKESRDRVTLRDENELSDTLQKELNLSNRPPEGSHVVKPATPASIDSNDLVPSVGCEDSYYASSNIEEPIHSLSDTVYCGNQASNGDVGDVDAVVDKVQKSNGFDIPPGHLIFSIVMSNDTTFQHLDVWVPANASWDVLTEAIAKRLKLFAHTSVKTLVLIDSAGDVLSPHITNASKFFKIWANYEEGMAFSVVVDVVEEEKHAKAKALEEFRALALRLSVRSADNGEERHVYIPRSCTWEEISTAIAEEFVNVEPQWIKHIIVEDADGDEISPPLNTAEKFWRFGRSASTHNGDVFVFSLDHERIQEDKKCREREAFLATCQKVCVQVQAPEDMPYSSSKEFALIPRGASWGDIRHHIALAVPECVKREEWISRLVLVDSDGDDLSPPIDGDLIFWKVMNTYDPEAGMTFYVFLEQRLIRKYEEELADAAFRASAKHFKVCMATNRNGQATDIYVPHDCNWEDLTSGVASFMGLSEASWIDYFILLDGEGDPLSPPLNTAAKFWKLGNKLSDDDDMTIYIHLKPDANRIVEEEAFMANACPFTVRWNADPSRKGLVHVLPDSSWDDICQRTADALVLDSAEWVSHMVLVDSEDGDVLSPAIMTAEKFWRFYKKHGGTSSFVVHEDEAMMARVIAERVKQQQVEKAREEERLAAELASKRTFHCRICDNTDTACDPFEISVSLHCGWSEILAAISSAGSIEEEFVDHLKLVDSNGLDLSVPISTSKMFWKFATNLDISNGSLFEVHVNHSYRTIVVKKRAEMALKQSMSLIHVSLSVEDKPDETLIHSGGSWEHIAQSIAESLSKREVEPEWIDHIVLYDVDGDQLSPALDTADKFWGVLPMYRIEESMVFVVKLNEEKINAASKAKAEEEFRKSARQFKVCVRNPETGVSTEGDLMVAPNCLWHDIVDAITTTFSLDDPKWVDYIVLYDCEGDVLSKPIDNTTLFWKVAGTYNFDDPKIYHVFLSADAIEKTRKDQAHAAFMAAAEHIPLLLANSSKTRATLHVLLNSSWDDICEAILEAFALEQPKSITRLILVDKELDELSPAVSCAEKFWKLYSSTFKNGFDMSFAVHTSNVPFVRGPPKFIPQELNTEPVSKDIVEQETLPSESEENAGSDEVKESASLTSDSPEKSLPGDNTLPDRAYRPRGVPVAPELAAEFLKSCNTVEDVIHYVDELGVDPNVENENKSTAMHFVCMNGNVDVAKALYERGANPNHLNAAGVAPLDCACIAGHIDICTWLHSLKCIDFSLHFSESGDLATPPLHLAAVNGHVNIVMWLMRDEVDKEVKGQYDTTALMEAAHAGQMETLMALVVAGADINACDKNGVTGFHLACAEGHLSVVQYLFSKGSSVNHADKNGKTAFMYACCGGHLEVAQWLVSAGANYHVTGGSYDKLNTPVHLAAQNGNVDLVQWLVEDLHLDPCALNEKGASPSDFSRAAGKPAVEHYLSKFGSTGNELGVNVECLEEALSSNNFSDAKRILERMINSYSDSVQLPYGTTPLHYVAASGHIELAQFLVMGGARVNAESDVKRTPLHYAAFKGRIEMCKYLFGVGANPNARDEYGYTGLSIASKNGDHELVSWFSSVARETTYTESSPVRQESSGSLFFGCIGQSTPVENFTEFRSDYDVKSPSREESGNSVASDFEKQSSSLNTTLHDACISGDLSRVKAIVEGGAQLNVVLGPDEPSALHCAVISGNISLVQYLLDKGAHLNAQNIRGSAAFDVDSDVHEAMTPLHIACDKKNESMIMFLIKKGADVNRKNKVGDTPLHIICLLGMHNVLQQIIDLPRSMVPNINLDVRSSHLLNLLHCAADAGSLETARILIDHDVGVNSFDDEKKTPIHYACGKGALDVVKLLVSKGAIVDLQDTSSRTPFLYACSSGNLDVVEFLVEQGARLDSETDKGNNALHIACKSGSLHLVKWLVSNGVDTLKQNSNGHLPAYYAQVNGHVEIVDWLEMKTGVKLSTQMEFES